MFSMLASWFKYNVPTSVRFSLLALFLTGLLSSGALGAYAVYTTKHEPAGEPKNKYALFAIEVHDKIMEHYWSTIDEAQLVTYYTRVAQHILGHTLVPQPTTRDTLFSALTEAVVNLPTDEERQTFVVTLSENVLQGLEPVGRSGLYTKKATEDLANRVHNVDPNADLYNDLGVEKGASHEQIAAAAEIKQQELTEKAKIDAAAKEELEKVVYAEEVLTDTQKKERYDTIGALPTVFSRQLPNGVEHVYIAQFSPSTYEELVRALEQIPEETVSRGLILDLRGNIGGSLDIVPYMLGPFIGAGNHAFSLFSKEVQDPIMTTTNALAHLKPYTNLVVLADQDTQSSGEVFVSTLKKYNVGVVVGTTTRGWGTVERIFSIDNQISDKESYGMFLVHSLTLGDNNQPIEGRGVTPHIVVGEDTWKEKLYTYGSTAALAQTVESIWDTPVPGS